MDNRPFGADHGSGPGARVYGQVFGQVWTAAVAVSRAMPRWVVESADPVQGEIAFQATGWLSRRARRGRIRITLDEIGLTRVAAVFLDQRGEPDRRAGARPIRHFFRRLERALAANPPA